jgi:tetratricopeptide (TPR) repeat protein
MITAREMFEKAVQLAPDHPSAYDGLGSTLWREGEWELAAEALEKAAALDPEQGALRFKLGMIYEELGRYEDAYKAFQALVGTYGDERIGEALARLQKRLGD